ncbi:MAG: DUF2807 domain-containing protein [Spirosomaceae bacterium]|nr:DUF2807 domain-containing protein [Spirosomataceae bacterium]
MKTAIFSRFALLSALLMILGVAAHAQSDDRITRTLNVRDFDRLSMGSAFQITVTKGNFAVSLEGRKKDLDDLEHAVANGKLRIGYKDWGWSNNRKTVKVTISMPTVKAIDFSGASSSKISGFNDLGALDLDFSGASSADLDLKADRIVMDVSGACTIRMKGAARRIEGEVSGASSIKAYDFTVKEAILDVSGASSMGVNVTGKLDAEASGASSVRYRGGASVRSNTSGASSVRSDS